MVFVKGQARPAGAGRKKGQHNRHTILLREAIMEAATKAGGKAGLVGYLQRQADDNPTGFLQILSKTLPRDVHLDQEGSIVVNILANLPPRAELPVIKDAEVIESGTRSSTASAT